MISHPNGISAAMANTLSIAFCIICIHEHFIGIVIILQYKLFEHDLSEMIFGPPDAHFWNWNAKSHPPILSNTICVVNLIDESTMLAFWWNQCYHFQPNTYFGHPHNSILKLIILDKSAAQMSFPISTVHRIGWISWHFAMKMRFTVLTNCIIGPIFLNSFFWIYNFCDFVKID